MHTSIVLLKVLFDVEGSMVCNYVSLFKSDLPPEVVDYAQESVGIQVVTLDLLVSKLLCILCAHLQEIMWFLGYPLLASKKQKQFEYHVDLLKDNRKDLE